jgi:antitoxin VapB
MVRPDPRASRRDVGCRLDYTLVDFIHHGCHHHPREADVALNIKNAEVERLAEEAARLAGETKTESIRKALEERLARLRLRVVRRDREAEAFLYLKREVWPSVPRGVLGKRLTRREEDRVLGYGPEGA